MIMHAYSKWTETVYEYCWDILIASKLSVWET